MGHTKTSQSGFTMIEMMITVGITGVLAAVAIPAFVGYLRHSKTAEATQHLQSLFTGSASYYEQEHWPQGLLTFGNATAGSNCTVATLVSNGSTTYSTANYGIKSDKQIIEWGDLASFEAINFGPPDPVYYQYAITGSTDTCGMGDSSAVYTFHANGNLDGDNVISNFELAVGSNEDNVLFRAPGVHITNENE